MTTEQNNHVLTAINAVMVSFTQQIVEQATKPLVERIARLEGQQEELYDIIKISLKGHVNNAVNISMAAVKQGITKEVLDEVDKKISRLASDDESISWLNKLIADAIDTTPIDADDIVGLKEFVENAIEDADLEIARTVRDEVESQLEDRDPVEKLKEALRNVADSM